MKVWYPVFGADQDYPTGMSLGFKKDHSLTYTAEGKYASYAFRTLSEQVKSASQEKIPDFSKLLTNLCLVDKQKIIINSYC